MRLLSLWIGEFKNLRDFTLEFDRLSSTTVLVGRNGTGKSNVLEAVTVIFRDLDLGEESSFAYKLGYLCREHRVEIDSDPSRPHGRVSIQVDGKPVPLGRFSKASERAFLPAYVFGYYSGLSDRMEEHYREHQQRFSRALLAGNDQPLRPMLYARPVHSQFALLAFFSEHDQTALDFLAKYLGVISLDSVLFVMKQPPWRSQEGDDRFWRARGVVQELLDRLYSHSLAPLRLTQRVAVGLSKSETREQLYLYLRSASHLNGLASAYSSQQGFFKALESMYISDLVADVRIRVRARNVAGVLTFRELSEGEQQLLMVLGLLRFTREEESLFLLDEPDTHLNPAWSIRYLEFLRDIGGAQANSHTLIATHDPLVIAGLQKEQVRLLRRDEKTGAVSSGEPEEDPFRLGVAGLLTSEVYGLRSNLAPWVVALLDRKSTLAAKQQAEGLSTEESTELEELNRQVADIDITADIRDPRYPMFVKAMRQLQADRGLEEVVLSGDQEAALRKLALEVVRDLGQRNGGDA